MNPNNEFRIRIVTGASVSIGVGVESMMLDICDVVHDQLCVYELRGISFSEGTPMAVSLKGPWNCFRTLRPMKCNQFAGLAQFATVFVMDKSVNALCLEPFGHPMAQVVPFNTGWTLGCGIGVGRGVLSLMAPSMRASKASWPHNVDKDTQATCRTVRVR